MKELLNQSHIQTADMRSMKDDMQCMKDDMRIQTMNMEVMQDDMHSQTVEFENMQENMCYQARAISNMQEEIRYLRKKCSVMESSLQKVDTRQQYHQVMLKNNKWELSLEDGGSLDRYLRSIQDDQSHTQQAEEFIEQIKHQTNMLRHGEGSGSVYINAGIHTNTILPYNRALFRYWYEFANALNDHKYMLNLSHEEGDESPTLTLEAVEIPTEVVSLFHRIKQTHFKTLELRNNNFGEEGIEFAINYMENNPMLKSFSLKRNPITRRLDASRLCRVAGCQPSLTGISLQDTLGEEVDGYGMLCGLMKAGYNNLLKIDFSENDVSTNGNTFFSYLIATNPVLEELLLDSNQFNDQESESSIKMPTFVSSIKR